MAPLQALLLSAAVLNAASSAALQQNSAVQSQLTPAGAPVPRPSTFRPTAINEKPGDAGEPVLEAFVSFSLELAFFPDYAGNKSNPNTFSDNLLNNIKKFQGAKPHIRVGGNTEDYALYDPNLKVATNGTYIPEISTDYPRILSIGPSFFDSYQTWPGTKFSHGFNLAKNGTEAANSQTAVAAVACKAFSEDNFLYWEMGNEPDFFKTSAQGIMRPSNWTESDYVADWVKNVNLVKESIRKSCGEEWVSGERWKWMAPSFGGVGNSLDAVKTWNAGLSKYGEWIPLFSSHNYIDGATSLGVTLAGTLMNHTRTVLSISKHNTEQKALKDAGMNMPYVLGEANSLYNQGRPGLSNTFGAALWGVDFNLMSAATNIRQVFMHMGTNFRYQSWQPITTNNTSIGTKAPYYGNIAVAAALGDTTKGNVRVQNIKLQKETEAAYAIYTADKLSRLMIINMQQHNYSVPEPITRGATTYNFTLPTSCAGTGLVQRLMANGSDAITGITFNGQSFNYDLDRGKPKLLGNVTKDETVFVGQDGGMGVVLPWSSAALVQLTC